MPIARWAFYDAALGETYTFPVNPNAGGSPSYSRKMDHSSTTAPEGTPITYEGRPEVPKVEFSGVLYTEDQYEAFKAWFGRSRALQMTDDLGRVQTIFILEMTIKPAPHAHLPWRHTYTVNYRLLAPAVI